MDSSFGLKPYIILVHSTSTRPCILDTITVKLKGEQQIR